jgi:MFS transporter, OFA family, oxalate/formate antiporter
MMIKSSGYQQTFLTFGIVQGAIVLGAAMLLVTPPKGGPVEVKRPRTLQGVKDDTPQEALRSPVFWIMYVMFVLVGAGGLMAVAQLGPIAKSFGISNVPVTIVGATPRAYVCALTQQHYERHHAPAAGLGLRSHRT